MAEKEYELGKQQIIDFFNLEFDGYRWGSLEHLTHTSISELIEKSLLAYEAMGSQARSEYNKKPFVDENNEIVMYGSAYLITKIATEWFSFIRYAGKVAIGQINKHRLEAKEDVNKGKRSLKVAHNRYERIFIALEDRIKSKLEDDPFLRTRYNLPALHEAKKHYDIMKNLIDESFQSLEPYETINPLDELVGVVASLLVYRFGGTQSRLKPEIQSGGSPLYRVLQAFVGGDEKLASVMTAHSDPRSVKAKLKPDFKGVSVTFLSSGN